MILPFSTQINGKPTYFAEKIKKSLRTNINYGFGEMFVPPGFNFYVLDKCKPKHHTIRNDEKEEFNEGGVVELATEPGGFIFAPPITIVSTQEVFMTYYHSDIIEISIDDRQLFSYIERLEFAINDGFDSWEDFFNYFYPKIQASSQKVYKRKLIHWTNLKY